MAVAFGAGTGETRVAPGPVGIILAIARRELRDALSSRWFALYSVGFTILASAIAFVSLAGAGSFGFAGFGRTTAGLLNLVMLVVPLMAIVAGSGSVASERERGSLLYLLAQPVARSEVLLGKFLGMSAALCSALCIGFGISAIIIAWRAGGAGAGAYVRLVGLTCLLSVAMVATGMLVSVASRKGSVAAGIGLFVWLCLVFVSDLGLMAGSVVFRLRVQELFALSLLNPLQAFKLGVIHSMNGSLDVLGPVGAYASLTFGHSLSWMLPLVLAAWTVAALACALVMFARRSPA